MNAFVDARDPASVEAVVQQALPVVGLEGVIHQLAALPGLQVTAGRARGVFRPAVPASVTYGDRTLRVAPGAAELVHIVGGIALAADPVTPAALPAVLAALVARAVDGYGGADQASVLLTALRDAVEVGQPPV